MMPSVINLKVFIGRGWNVQATPALHPSQNNTVKPDIILHKEGIVWIIDAQIVSAATSLNASHERKSAKYNTDEIRMFLAREYSTGVDQVRTTSATISWRGVWSVNSASSLLELRVPKSTLAGITTRVLQGSSTNWNRWNKMTTVWRANRAGLG